MRIRFITSIIFFLLLSACNKKNTQNLNVITANIERVLISREDSFPSITFIISFKNNSEKTVVLFTNSLFDNDYMDSGITMKNENFTVPLEGLIPEEKLLYIGAKSEAKFAFIYSKQYTNNWKEINKNDLKQELTNIINNMSLSYNHDELIIKNYSNKFDSSQYFLLDKDFQISKGYKNIEYKKKLNLEEIVKMTGGRIISQ